MHVTANLHGRAVAIELTQAANDALAQRSTPLLAEMELYFSCLVRKKVRFHDGSAGADRVHVTDKLAVHFRPVMTRACRVSEVEGEEPPITDFPITNAAAFVPRWLRIDYGGGEWSGEFGYGN